MLEPKRKGERRIGKTAVLGLAAIIVIVAVVAIGALRDDTDAELIVPDTVTGAPDPETE